MAVRTTKFRLFQEHSIPTEGGDVLHAKMMMPKPPCQPQRVVFISPLVGAGAAQTQLIFRSLTRRGSILLSFEYRGHLHSTGTFTLDRTVSDVKHALIWAWNYANDRNLPLHGFTTCYGTIPLLAQFADNGCGVLLQSLSTICGLFRLDQIMKLENFMPILSRHLGRELSCDSVLQGLHRNELDCDSRPFRQALHEFLAGLFPELRIQYDRFEELSYDRADVAATLRQFLESRYLEGVKVPAWMPCHFFYGHNDELLSVDTAAGSESYRKHVLSLVPHAVIDGYDIDHYGRGPEHEVLMSRLGDIWEQYDGLAAHHEDYQGLVQMDGILGGMG